MNNKLRTAYGAFEARVDECFDWWLDQGLYGPTNFCYWCACVMINIKVLLNTLTSSEVHTEYWLMIGTLGLYGYLLVHLVIYHLPQAWRQL